MDERCGMGEVNGSRTESSCACATGASQERTTGRGREEPFLKGAVFVGLPGPVGQQWLPLSLHTLLWLTLESDEGGERVGTCQV